MKYARIDDGKVVEIILPAADDDGSSIAIERRFHPDFVSTLVAIPVGQEVATGDTWAEANGFGPAPPPPALSADHVKATRDALLAEATLRIAPLQDAIDLDAATASEAAELKAWKQYRVALSRVAQQLGFPADVEWPAAPS